MRAFDVPKAKEMFLNMVKWREDFGVDAIVKVNTCTYFKRLYYNACEI